MVVGMMPYYQYDTVVYSHNMKITVFLSPEVVWLAVYSPLLNSRRRFYLPHWLRLR